MDISWQFERGQAGWIEIFGWIVAHTFAARATQRETSGLLLPIRIVIMQNLHLSTNATRSSTLSFKDGFLRIFSL